MLDGNYLRLFWVELPVGASLSTGATAGEADTWYDGMPSWSGHTIRIFELSEAPIDAAEPTAAPISSISTPGRFVGGDLSDGDLDTLSAVLGQRATVAGSGGAAELFPGVTATMEASALPAGEVMELWIAKDFNYAFFQIFGGGLPVGAVKVGEKTVAADGTLTADFALPSNLALGGYQLVVGVRAERYWPAGSYDDFQVTTPTIAETVTIDDEIEADFTVGVTTVTLDFPGATSGGEITTTGSATGPMPNGFTLTSNPPLYYHVNTTAALGSVTICILYNPANLPGSPPRLYHFEPSVNRWSDITTSTVAGQVCGVTSSFSPFVLGYPDDLRLLGLLQPGVDDRREPREAGSGDPREVLAAR